MLTVFGALAARGNLPILASGSSSVVFLEPLADVFDEGRVDGGALVLELAEEGLGGGVVDV